MVETMLKLHKDLPKTRMPHEQEFLKRQIAATDKQLDTLVYELYGLTEEKPQIVEGGEMTDRGIGAPRISPATKYGDGEVDAKCETGRARLRPSAWT